MEEYQVSVFGGVIATVQQEHLSLQILIEKTFKRVPTGDHYLATSLLQ